MAFRKFEVLDHVQYRDAKGKRQIPAIGSIVTMDECVAAPAVALGVLRPIAKQKG
jgi:hypothetical protein